MKLEITKERILEAASKCTTAKATLQVLFPEAFVEEKPRYPMQVGDVYKNPMGYTNPFVLVRVAYAQDSWVLQGMGLGPNSGSFHKSGPHTQKECEDYLAKCNMEYSHNINNAIYSLHNKGAKVV